MSKLGLVLEGGGMRGAYTAGCLAWMIDNQIEVDYGVGISAGAVNLCSYYLKDKNFLYDITVKYMSDKRNVGIVPLLKERRYVGYDYMFDDLMPKQIHYDISPLKNHEYKIEIGIYDMLQSKTIYFGIDEMDDDLRMIKAACSLPIAGRIVDYQGKRFLDGGISVMIPLERALEEGCDKTIVIITKPDGYVRKAAGKFMQWLMKFNYRKFPQMVYDYTHRHENYNAQMEKIEKEVEAGRCVLIRPSETIPVKRFSGDPDNLEKLYHLGYADMEKRKAEILSLVKN